MMIDRTTKALLLAIAIGLWVNAAREMLRPVPLEAVQGIPDVWTELTHVYQQLANISIDLRRIQNGTCTNSTIC